MYRTTKEKTKKTVDSFSEEDQYSPVILGELLQENREWVGVKDIVKLSIKSLYDVIQSQGNAIREIENSLSNKLAMEDIIPHLEQKANSTNLDDALNQLTINIEQKPNFEQVKQLVEDNFQEIKLNILSKIENPEKREKQEKQLKEYDSNLSILDLKNDLALLNEKVEELYKIIDLKLDFIATEKDIEKLNVSLSEKISMAQLNDALEKKGNQEELKLIKAKENFVSFDQLQSITQQKVDLDEFNSTIFSIKNSLDALSEKKNQDLIYLNNLEKKIQNNLHEVSTKLIELDNSCSLRKSTVAETKIISLENKLGDLTKELNQNIENINHTIIEKTNPSKLESILLHYVKKVQIYEIENKINELNCKYSDIFKENFSKIKKEAVEIQGDKDKFKFKMEPDPYEMKLELIYKEVKSLKENIHQITEEKLFSENELEKKISSQIENIRNNNETEITKFKDQIYKFEKRIEMSHNDIEKNNLEFVTNFRLIDEKFETISSFYKNEINSKISEISNEFKSSIHQQEISFINMLNQKANLIDLKAGLSNKLDISGIKNLNLNEINNNESKEDQVKIIKTLVDAKANISDLDVLKNNIFDQVNELSKHMKLKSDIKDVCILLDTKLSIKDFEQVNNEIQKEIYGKTNKEDLVNFISEQGEINKLILSDNCIGRWNSKLKELINGHLIIWNNQLINNYPENYIWDCNSSYLIINHPGLYEISVGLYTKSNPSAKLNINGECIANIQSLKCYNEIKEHKIISNSKTTYGNILGATLHEFLILPARAKISISYNGEKEGEGFLGLKKLSN